jgi:CRP-like cAMP-binding protein
VNCAADKPVWSEHEGGTAVISCPNVLIATLSSHCLQVNYAAGEPVWSEREGGDLFYIIKEGSALLKDAASGAVISKLGPGAHFGQQSLLGPGMQTGKAVSAPAPCVLFSHQHLCGVH